MVVATALPAGSQPDAPAMLTVRQVAALLSVSVRHVFRLSERSNMPLPRRLGTAVRWSRQEVLDWIANGCPPCRSADQEAADAQ